MQNEQTSAKKSSDLFLPFFENFILLTLGSTFWVYFLFVFFCFDVSLKNCNPINNFILKKTNYF